MTTIEKIPQPTPVKRTSPVTANVGAVPLLHMTDVGAWVVMLWVVAVTVQPLRQPAMDSVQAPAAGGVPRLNVAGHSEFVGGSLAVAPAVIDQFPPPVTIVGVHDFPMNVALQPENVTLAGAVVMVADAGLAVVAANVEVAQSAVKRVPAETVTSVDRRFNAVPGGVKVEPAAGYAQAAQAARTTAPTGIAKRTRMCMSLLGECGRPSAAASRTMLGVS